MSNFLQIFRKPLPWLVAAGCAVLFLFFTGCSVLLPQPTPFPTATVTPSFTPTATVDWFPATPTPTGTPRPTAAPQLTLPDQQTGLGDLLVRDDFTDPELWATLQSPSGNIAFGENNLTLALAREESTLVSISRHGVPADFYLSIGIETALCSPEDAFGLTFWEDAGGNFYRLLLNCSGQYRLELVQGGQTIPLQDWETARRMQPGAPAFHKLGLWAREGGFRLYINDTFQFEEKLAQGRSGLLSVFARTHSSAALTVKFSDLEIYEVASEGTTP
jgi:hypothetical protein